MDEAAVVIVALRLLLPLLILRFPITGLILTMLADMRDHDFLGQYEAYQTIDKWLDFYYLTICAWVVKSWQDKIAKKLALWLFAYRFVGVIVLSFTSAEWTILLFPDLFGFFFIFYILYVQFSGSKQLFKNWRSTIPVMIAIFLPKMIQEFSLHIVLPYADKLPEWAVKINDMPYSLLTTPLFIAPFVLIAVYTYRVRRASSKTRSPITPA